jgi:hypothetical protein
MPILTQEKTFAVIDLLPALFPELNGQNVKKGL